MVTFLLTSFAQPARGDAIKSGYENIWIWWWWWWPIFFALYQYVFLLPFRLIRNSINSTTSSVLDCSVVRWKKHKYQQFILLYLPCFRSFAKTQTKKIELKPTKCSLLLSSIVNYKRIRSLSLRLIKCFVSRDIWTVSLVVAIRLHQWHHF